MTALTGDSEIDRDDWVESYKLLLLQEWDDSSISEKNGMIEQLIRTYYAGPTSRDTTLLFTKLDTDVVEIMVDDSISDEEKGYLILQELL